MNYEQFVQAVAEEIRAKECGRLYVTIHTATKNNGRQRKGLLLSEEGINISPAIYLEEYYEQFQRGGGLKKIAADVVRLYTEVRFHHSWNENQIHQFDGIKGKIVFRLIGREMNRELLSRVPHERFLDLAVVFYVLLEMNECGMAAMQISNDHMKQWNITLSELRSRAMENTPQLLPGRFQTVCEVLEELDEKPEEGRRDMYVLSNHIRSFGAAVLLYPGKMKEIGVYFDTDYFVFPSSVHEVLILPADKMLRKEELSAVVQEINETQLAAEDILSNHVYYYDRKKEKLLE